MENIKSNITRFLGSFVGRKASGDYEDNPQRILIVALYFIGDIVFQTPALTMVRRIFPKSEIHVWCKSRTKDIFENNPNVDKVIVYDGFKITDYEDVAGSGLISKISFIRKLRKEKYDILIDLTSRYFTAICSYFLKPKFSLGYNYNGFEFCYNKVVDIKTSNSKGHLIDKYLILVRNGFNISEDRWSELVKEGTNKPEFYIGEEEINFARKNLITQGFELDKPIIAIHTTAGWEAKQWSPAAFSALVKKLSSNGLQIILLGTESERRRLEEIADSSNTGDISEKNIFTLSLEQNAALIGLSDVLVGSDSAPLHIAGALDIPSVGLFGPTNPDFSNPVGEKHTFIYHRFDCSAGEYEQYCTLEAGRICPTVHCMTSITVDDVYSAVINSIKKFSTKDIIAIEKN